MPAQISINEFISHSNKYPVIDVRSESEFAQGHFPYAINIPMLNDEHRKEVGTTYKQKGRHEAVIKGFDLAGGKFGEFIRQIKNVIDNQHSVISKKNEGTSVTDYRLQFTVLLYCWRGGMRSAIAEWILSLAGIKALRLKGGYKAFRNWCLQILKQEKKVLVLGGMTGSGKTEILQYIAQLGECVIDLENLAHHKGSAFGGLGQQPQPTNEHFENLLALQWANISDENFVWLENESRTIGKNQLPYSIYEQIRNANVVEITAEHETRLQRILNEYAHFPVEQLIEKTMKLKKRLGGQHLKESLEYLNNKSFENWAKKMLDYYDKNYTYGMQQREKVTIHPIKLKGDNYFEFATEVQRLGKAVMNNCII